MKTLLSVKNLKKSYSGRSVVNGVSFDIKPGEIVGLLGPNGAGKTTSFYMTMGLIASDEGEVIFKDQDITSLSMDKRARLGMGYLAQEPSVFPSLSVKENILLILEEQNLSKKEKEIRLNELLDELHLKDLANTKACKLSGGERRRLEITRSLVTNPSLLLLDEPFANIDPLAIADVQNLIRHLKEKGISVLITDHNAREIFSIVDRSYLLIDGKVMQSGTVQELLDDSNARTLYFGESFKL